MRNPLRAAIVLALILTSCGSLTSASPSPSRSVAASASPTPSATTVAGRQLSSAEAERLAGPRVQATLDALKARNGALLAAIAHPTKGVRFSPYPYVVTAKNIVLMRSDLAAGYGDARTRTWGITDGKGDPITLTFSDYVARYVWSRDFLAAPRTAYNGTIGRGNSIDNTADVYPDAILFEAYDPGPDPALQDVHWQCLRLLFERAGAEWYLVGVVHGEWTI